MVEVKKESPTLEFIANAVDIAYIGSIGSALVASIASLGAGAYHGYCDSQGIPFEKENTEFWLTYGPGLFSSLAGTLVGSTFGANLACSLGEKSVEEEKLLDGIKCIAFVGTVLGVPGAVVGAVVGGALTLTGYGAGYVAGQILK